MWLLLHEGDQSVDESAPYLGHTMNCMPQFDFGPHGPLVFAAVAKWPRAMPWSRFASPMAQEMIAGCPLGPAAAQPR